MSDLDLDKLESEAKVAWDMPSDTVEALIRRVRAAEADADRFYEKVNGERTGNTVLDLLRDAEDRVNDVPGAWQERARLADDRIDALRTLVKMKEAVIDRQGTEIKALRKENGHLQQFGRKQAWRAKQAELQLAFLREPGTITARMGAVFDYAETLGKSPVSSEDALPYIVNYVTRLQQVVDIYSWHRPVCAYLGSVGNTCDCGYDAALAALEGKR